MKLRVLVGLCVLVCLAVPLSAQIIPNGATGEGNASGVPGDLPVEVIVLDEMAHENGSIEYAEVAPGAYGKVFVTVAATAANTAFIRSEQLGEQRLATLPHSVTLPRLVALERAGNIYLVRNVEGEEGMLTVTMNDWRPNSGTDSRRHTLAPGETRFFAAPVTDGTSHTWVDIRWDTSAGDLILNLYPPDGRLGPYTDTDDGRRDGRIFLDVSSLEGLASGDWYYEVSQPGGEGPVEFTFETYA